MNENPSQYTLQRTLSASGTKKKWNKDIYTGNKAQKKINFKFIQKVEKSGKMEIFFLVADNSI